MREILFRGKTKTGEWVEGSLVTDTDCCYIGGRIKEQQDEVVRHYGSVTFYKKSPAIAEGFSRVDPDTIGQYTGLEDKNGEKIFEGDIVYWPKEVDYGHVMWTKDESRFAIEFSGCFADFDNLWGFELEVEGNIYDNPELLEVTP